MSNRGPFKGLWAAKLPNTPCWAAGSTWHTLKGSRAALTQSNPKKKKKKKPFPLPEFKDVSRKYFRSSYSKSIQSGKIQS